MSTIVSSPKPQPWDGIIPAEELAIYERAGWGAPGGMGCRPAMLVIDVQYRSMGERSLPIHEAIRESATSCGEYGWRALPHIAALLAVFREMRAPVLYPHVAFKGPHNRGQFEAKVPGVMDVPLR